MTASQSLPSRPSLESLRKQAKKLARESHSTLRDAQLVVARTYGFPGWQDLLAEVSVRLGNDLERAATEARRVIHDNDVERLKQLLAKYPALLSWTADNAAPPTWPDGSLLAMATGAYGDSFDPEREKNFTRAACAEILIDAGAVVTPAVCDGLVESRARGLLALFQRKGLLPRTLKFFAALGDLDAARATLDENGKDPAAINEAFFRACAFEHEAIASLLLERSIAIDAELGPHVEASGGRAAFITFLIEHRSHDFAHATPAGPWQVFVRQQVRRAVGDGDLTAFVSWLQRDPSLLADAGVPFQTEIIGQATLNDRGEFITALLDLNPALLRRQPPPPSQAIEFAFTYTHTHLLPLLLRIWPLPDDLPHAAGNGDFARVRRWFDAEGKPALGDVAHHAPATSVHPREPQWGGVGVQQVLDTALAWSVLNHHFEVADFLLEHGADINTNWNSHEPASILHALVFENDYEAMRFLIDRGIDMTITDYRWNSTAQGWARYAAKDEKLAQWLEEAERQRGRERDE